MLRWFARERRPPETSAPPPAEAPPPPAPAAPQPAEPALRASEVEAQPRPDGDVSRAGGSLRSAGQMLGSAAGAARRVPAAAGRGARRFWLSMSVQTRERLAIAGGALAVLLIIAFVAVPALPCQVPGGDACPPSDDAIHLVPDDALGYLHVNLDSNTDQYEQAGEIAGRIPGIAKQVNSRLLLRVPGPGGRPPDFANDIQPWFGGQAALAIVPAGGRAAEEVQLLQVDDDAAARRFADSVATGAPETTDYRDVPVSIDGRGLATALVGGFLAIGRESGVRDVIDAQSGAEGTGSLADEPAARAAREALPDDRLADAYMSPDGIDRLVGNPRGPLATLDAAVDPTASEGVAMALVTSDAGIDVAIRSELDRARAKAEPAFFAAFPAFEPTLTSSLPAESLAYVGMADPGRTLVSLIGQASADQPGLASAVAGLVRRVRQLGRVDLEADLLPSLGGEAAFALQPAPGGGAADQPASGIPYLEFLSSGIDSNRAGDALSGLQAPIAEALNPSTGQAPTFSQRTLAGVTAHIVRLSPTVELTYAIAGSVLLIATNPVAVKQLGGEEDALAEDAGFKEATAGLPGSVSLLAYLNLDGLLTLGEQAGLAQDPAYEAFATELRKLRGLGLTVRQSPTELATDLRLIVSEEASAATSSGGAGSARGGD